MIASSIASASRGHGQPAREDDGSPLHQFLCFALGLEPCAVRIDLVREILEVGHMTPLPLMPAFVRGVMNLRGVVVPVIDLGARLGLLPLRSDGKLRVVVARGADGSSFAFPIRRSSTKSLKERPVVFEKSRLKWATLHPTRPAT